MKKIFLIGLAATAMLASCSNDETVEMAQNNKAIQFDGFVNKSTRAADVTTANLTSFKVWGLMSKDQQTGNPFTDVEVTKTGDAWSYTLPVYWENGYNYSFVAVAPTAQQGTAAGQWALTAPTSVGTYGSISFNNGEGTTDLIYDVDGTYAESALELTEGTCPLPINFTFNHLLSRVKFAFTNGMDDGSTINVTDVKITDANTKATATLGETATWTLAGDNATEELEFGNVLDATDDYAINVTKDTDHKYMIPALSENQTYTVNFTVKRNHNGVTDTYDLEATLTNDIVNFEQGKSYRFVAVINQNALQLCPIVFTAEVTEWEEFTDVSVPGYLDTTVSQR